MTTSSYIYWRTTVQKDQNASIYEISAVLSQSKTRCIPRNFK
jgi:hypothetical protein